MHESTTHVYLTPVARDRADDFDRFIRDNVVPAVEARRPEQAGRWRLLRPSRPDGEAVTFVFLLDGGTEEDWDLGRVFEEHYGVEEAQRLGAEWDGMLFPVRRWADALAGPDDIGQVGWTCTAVGGTGSDA